MISTQFKRTVAVLAVGCLALSSISAQANHTPPKKTTAQLIAEERMKKQIADRYKHELAKQKALEAQKKAAAELARKQAAILEAKKQALIAEQLKYAAQEKAQKELEAKQGYLVGSKPVTAPVAKPVVQPVVQPVVPSANANFEVSCSSRGGVTAYFKGVKSTTPTRNGVLNSVTLNQYKIATNDQKLLGKSLMSSVSVWSGSSTANPKNPPRFIIDNKWNSTSVTVNPSYMEKNVAFFEVAGDASSTYHVGCAARMTL